MTPPRTPALAAIAVIAVAVGTTFGAVLVASPASAHSYLIASTPAAGEQLTELPEAFSVTANETLLDVDGTGSGFAIDVTGADGLHYGDGCVTVIDATMSMTAALGGAGGYTLTWQLVSADGHTVSGEIPFTWAPAAGVEPSTGSADEQRCGQPVPSAAPDPGTAAPPSPVSLSDLLWIGGAVLAVLIAAGVTLLVLTRKRKPE